MKFEIVIRKELEVNAEEVIDAYYVRGDDLPSLDEIYRYVDAYINAKGKIDPDYWYIAEVQKKMLCQEISNRIFEMENSK